MNLLPQQSEVVFTDGCLSLRLRGKPTLPDVDLDKLGEDIKREIEEELDTPS